MTARGIGKKLKPPKEPVLLVIYSCSDEVLMCVPQEEDRLIRKWFTEGGRCLSDYTRHARTTPLDGCLLQVTMPGLSVATLVDQ